MFEITFKCVQPFPPETVILIIGLIRVTAFVEPHVSPVHDLLLQDKVLIFRAVRPDCRRRGNERSALEDANDQFFLRGPALVRPVQAHAIGLVILRHVYCMLVIRPLEISGVS